MSALRTISLRLRGTSVKVLEEMGEETEGVIESTSKLQSKIKALSGIDILTETGDYKDTYTILKEIGQVWEDMADIDQAALLELMAGKNRANTLSAILGNMKDLEGAYNSALEAEGSALAENAAYLDSIQGRVDLFKNSVQTMWMNFLSADAAKFFVDLGTAAIKLVDTLGLIPSILGGFAAFKFASHSITTSFAAINKEIEKSIAAKNAGVAASEANAVAQTQENVAKNAGVAASEANAVAQTQENVAEIAGVAAKKAGAAASWKDVIATNAQTAATKSLAVAKGLLKGIVGGIAVMAITSIISKAFDAISNGIDRIINRAKYIKEEAKEITDAYKKATDEIKDNLETLTASGDTKLYDTLEEEFKHLASGVDKYGNNISLASDEYERYREICEQIVGVNPKIAAGYDSATKAIGNNVSILSQLIELQKQQARQNAKDIISDKSLDTLAGAAFTDIDEYKTDNPLPYGDAKSRFNSAFAKAVEAYEVQNTKTVNDYYDILKALNFNGYKWADYSGSLGVDIYASNFASDFYEQIVEDLRSGESVLKDYFTNEEINNLLDIASEYDANISVYNDKINDLRDGLIDTLLQVPYSLEEYDNLNDPAKSFITEWIKNSEMFKIDPNATEEEIKQQLKDGRDLIEQVVKDFGDETIQSAFDGISDLDKSSLSVNDYLDQVYKYRMDIWDAIGGKQNKYGFKTISDIDAFLGVDFDSMTKQAEDSIQVIANYLDKNKADIRKYIRDNMSQEEYETFIKIDWNLYSEDISNISDIYKIIRQEMGDIGRTIQTYSDMSSEIESFNDVLSQTSEILVDNTEVTQEYKDALAELGVSEEEFSECFDENNKLVVKNAALLQKLVSQKKDEKRATVQAAKAQSQMQYRNTTKQLQQVVSAMEAEYKASGKVADATLRTADALRSQLTALQQTIQQYALLELKLSDAANAYDKFEAAKERDAELSYGDSMIEMLEVINEGFKTGQTGSEAFQAAVEALVPESVYKDIDNLEDKMIAIHDYIDKDGRFADYFTVDEDGFSIGLKNIKAFIEDGLSEGVGVFNGTIDNFTLDESITSLSDLASAYGITEAAALAMLSELEKYDSAWGDIIAELTTNPLDREINNATTALEEALQAQEEYIRSGKSLDSDEYKTIQANVNAATDALNQATTAAQQNAQAYIQLETVYAGLTGKIQLTQEQVNSLAKSLGLVDENGNVMLTVNDDGTITATDQALSILNKKQEEITSKPSIIDIQLNYDNLSTQIDELQKYIDGTLENSENSEILKELNITNLEDAKAKLAELTAERDTITLNYNITSTTSEQETGVIEKLTTWESDGMTFTVSANVDAIQGAVDTANTALDGIEDEEVNITANDEPFQETKDEVDMTTFDPKVVEISETGADVVKSAIDEIAQAVYDIPDSHVIKFYADTGELGEVNLNGGAGADGNFHLSGGAFAGGSIGAPSSETALVGELGPELVVRNGRWFTVGDNGAEFTQVKRGDIIFNHKQTEDLLSKGYVTGRGKAYASGTAYFPGKGKHGIVDPYVGDETVFGDGSDKWVDAGSDLSDAASDLSDAADEFKDVFDWVEVRLEEIDETLGLLESKLENAANYIGKNSIIDEIISVNNTKLTNLKAGYQEYADYAAKILAEIPEEYRDAAQNGAINIEKFADEAGESTLELIENYREWAQKAADLQQQVEEVITSIRDLAIQQIDNIQEYGDAKTGIEDAQTEKLQNVVDLIEESGNIATAAYYEAMMENSSKKIEYWTPLLENMQAEFDDAVRNGIIEVGSIEWYEQIEKLYETQSAIAEATIELEEFQNAINDIYWDNFDELINRFDYLHDETQSLIDLMDNADMVIEPEGITYDGGDVEYWTAEDVKWTEEGIATLGLYAQQMEIAEYKSKQYAKAIDDLTTEYEAGHYSESEYLEKLNELKDAQYESIEAYYDAQDAIKDLNEVRIDSIKKGIEKEIEAYQELIEKKKEALDSEKDLFDFQKSIQEKNKNIADIQRKLASLAADNSASARAKRAQLEAELAEAQQELEETYYDRSISDQQDALDKELENFEKEKDAEVEKWEEYLENIEQVVADSLGIVQANASGIYDTLSEKADEYNLTLSDSIMLPWQDGALAVSDYQTTFDTAMSSTMDQLDVLKSKWQEVIDKMAEAGNATVDAINKENAAYASATKSESNISSSSTTSSTEKAIAVGGTINAGNAQIYSDSDGTNAGEQYYANDPIYVVLDEINGYLKVRHHSLSSGVSGWFKKSDVNAYAKGTTGTKKDEIALIDELGEELQLIPDGNGRLAYMKKGTGVVPADLTANLMKWGKLDPTNMLEQNRPQIGVSPSVVNNTTEIHIDASVGELLHVERLDGNNPAEITKIVDKAWDKHMKELNAYVRRYVR